MLEYIYMLQELQLTMVYIIIYGSRYQTKSTIQACLHSFFKRAKGAESYLKIYIFFILLFLTAETNSWILSHSPSDFFLRVGRRHREHEWMNAIGSVQVQEQTARPTWFCLSSRSTRLVTVHIFQTHTPVFQ